tara:strand:- start:699 stop:806 length:108 start_codon:yes stop_codon:yes gene_type:complete
MTLMGIFSDNFIENSVLPDPVGPIIAINDLNIKNY